MTSTTEVQKKILTDRLRQYTRGVHDESDTIINYKLIVTFADRELYGKAISFFYHVYQTLEDLIKKYKEHPSLTKIYVLLPIIERTGGFESDLKFFLGDDWRSKTTNPPQAVVEYVTHLKEVAKRDPTLLLAYIYHMYMAIFAGGFIIKRMARKAMGLPPDTGTKLFELKGSINPGIIRKEIKESINSLRLEEVDIQKLLQESHSCFQRNNMIASSIEGVSEVFFRKLAKLLFIVFVFGLALLLFRQYSL